MQLSWSDPRLSVASDSRRTARYRLLQSWYREQVLTARYGDYCGGGGHSRPLGSLLHVEDVVARPWLNFLTPAAAKYALDRAAIVTRSGAAIDKARLARNMLSSLPMSFSIFGELRSRPDRGLDVVRAFLDPHAVDVAVMECVWRPSVDVLGDHSGFDAVVVTTRADGSRHLVGVDVKYTETFNPTIYNSDSYRQAHEYSGWFHPGTTRPLLGPATNHLWRTNLLAAACEQTRVMGISSASVVVMCLSEDPDAARALAGLSAALREPERCRIVSLESFVAGMREGLGAGEQWAEKFATRYLDPPVMPAELPDMSAEEAPPLEL
jgi:PD-(D/E)XK nuclease superfamily protein